MTILKAKFITEVSVVDPDSKGEVHLEIWKDPESGGIFAIDSSYLDQVTDRVLSPFNKGVTLILDADQFSHKE